GVVFFRPFSLEHGLGLAITHLLFPVRPYGPAVVMPDHGCRTEPQLSSSFSRSPANIHVVTGLPEFRIKSVDGIQPASAESHVATWNVLCFAIGKEHMRSEEHTSELQSLAYLVCRLLLEKKNKIYTNFK